MKRLLLASLLAVGCSDPGAPQSSGSTVSEQGLADVGVEFEGPVVRGDNRLRVTLKATHAGDAAQLLAVDASMAAHAHQAHAGSITEGSEGFEVEQLDLFMTGRWQLELKLAIEGEPDSASLPVDVP